MKLHFIIWTFLILLIAGQFAYYGPKLPDPTPSHFGFNGQPDDWMTKNKYMWVTGGIYLSTLVLVSLFCFALPQSIKFFSDNMINIPNKEYWLAPQRRTETLANIKSKTYQVGYLTLGLIVGIFHLGFESSAATEPRFSTEWFFALMLFYLLAMGIWILKLYLSFRNFKKKGQISFYPKSSLTSLPQ